MGELSEGALGGGGEPDAPGGGGRAQIGKRVRRAGR